MPKETKESEMGTLDLSMKKPRSPEFINNHIVHGSQSIHPSKNGSHTSHPTGIPVPPPLQPHMYKHPAPSHEPPSSSYYAPTPHVSVIT